MSNPLYEQLKTKVEASPLAQDKFGVNPLGWRQDFSEAERLRSLAVAGAFSNLFSNIFETISNFGETLDRARLANALSKLDEARLADIGLNRTDLPAYVAGYVTEAQVAGDVSATRESVRKAA
jgi:uncharacterized protein YjiS (DUF1127 family)